MKTVVSGVRLPPEWLPDQQHRPLLGDVPQAADLAAEVQAGEQPQARERLADVVGIALVEVGRRHAAGDLAREGLEQPPGQRALGLGLGALLVAGAQAPSPTGLLEWPLRDVAVALMAEGIIGGVSTASGAGARHDLERVAGDRVALVDVLDRLRPAPVGRAGDEHRRALVGEHQPVALERAHDGQRGAAVGRLVEGGLQAPARAVGRGGGVGRRPAVARRRLPGAARARQREAQGVADGPRGGLVVAQQAGEDGQPGRVGRGPAGRRGARCA